MRREKSGFRFTILATDIAIFTIEEEALKVLLVETKKEVFRGLHAVPGGLVRPSETVDQSAERNLFETIGSREVYLEQLYTFGEVDRDPQGRIVSVTYFALTPDSKLETRETQDYDSIKWYSVNALPELAYDHNEVLRFAIERLRSKVTYSNIIFGLLSDEFTLSQLQRAYEIVLDRKLDKRNFRKKIISLNLLAQTGKKTIGKAYRPADIYQFKEKSPKIIQIL